MSTYSNPNDHPTATKVTSERLQGVLASRAMVNVDAEYGRECAGTLHTFREFMIDHFTYDEYQSLRTLATELAANDTEGK